jgi:hypothetical protein
VIGVVQNGRENAILEKPAPLYYLPLDHRPPEDSSMLAASTIELRVDPARAADVTTILRGQLRGAFPGTAPQISLLRDDLARQYRPWRVGAELFSAFGLLALVVAAVGIYGTVSYTTSQRLHEFGVRVALGAGIENIVKLVVWTGVRMVAVGVAAGIALALLGGRFVASLLYGVTTHDAVAIAGVAVAMLLVAVVAALGPAARAARVDPVTALRAD